MKIILLIMFGALFFVQNASASPQFNATKYESLETLLPVQKTAADKIRLLQVLSERAPFDEMGPTDQSMYYLEQLLLLNRKEKLIDAAPYEALYSSFTFWKKRDFRAALQDLDKSISLFDKQQKIIPDLIQNIRMLYNLLNDHERRYAYYIQKLEYYNQTGQVENTAACLHGLAGYFSIRADYNQAINYYLKAAEVFKSYYPEMYINELAVAGHIYLVWGNKEKAAYYLEKALPLIKKYKVDDDIIYCLVNLSQLAVERENFELALQYLNEVYGTKKADLLEETGIILQKGYVYLAMNQPKQALPFLEKAKVVLDSLNAQISQTSGVYEIDYYMYLYNKQVGNLTAAGRYLKAAIQKAEDEKTPDFQMKYSLAAAEFYTSINQLQKALQYYQHHQKLFELQNKSQNKFKVAQYEFDQRDKAQLEHINQLKQEKAIQSYAISRRNTMLWAALVVVLLISGSILFIYKQLQANKKTLLTLRTTQRQLIQSEKLASLGELTAGIAHEIQNPLNFVNNFSEVSTELLEELEEEIQKGETEEAFALVADIKENLLKINHHGKRADSIVKGMLQHSRSSTGTKELTDINALADEYLRLSYHGLRAKDKTFNATLETNFASDLGIIKVNPQDLGRVLLNLFNNAFYAVQQKRNLENGSFKPTVSVSTFKVGDSIQIEVRDNGSGIPDNIRNKIMQPFFTTKPTGQGTGLGLSLSHDIIAKGHGGRLEVVSEDGEYTAFTISIPAKQTINQELVPV